ncbi:MAG: DNA polymerase III epsilon subunit-like 3'-5' exonuclease [Bacteroidetes bacterium 38_7]|nr:MAG: DNA polymerase III epsilon subunit-like 3'-5' exonuclease [Bacteroidetes bacterium 38_7]HAL65658.1 DNA polymerase III subunit epsilon [Bacteroidales bacterium]
MNLKLTRPLAFIDLETTGLNIGHDRIVEISILKLHPDGNTETYTRRINPTIPIPAEVTRIHGITDEDVKNEPTFSNLAPEIAKFLKDCDLAGYNSNKFDVPMLMEEFLRAGIEFPLTGKKLIDVQNIFHKMEPRNLEAAYKFYCNRDLVNAHSAEADITATFEILLAQIERYAGKEVNTSENSHPVLFDNTVSSLHQISFQHKNADFAGHIIYNEQGKEVFNFGKYKGKVVEEIFRKEPSYCDWMMKADFPLYTKKIITAIKLRGFNKGRNDLNEGKV